MELKRYRETIEMYDAEGTRLTPWAEVRFHPLTGEISRIIQVPLRKLDLPDLEKMAAETRATCPFCPEHLGPKTPKFDTALLPGGELRRGRVVLIPNRFPYDRYCALIILSDRHYVPLDAWHPREIADALMVGQAFLNRVMEHDPTVQAFSLNWNYAPPSGSSILHPHIQLSAGAFATNRARRLFHATRGGGDPFAELLETEETLGQRWCERTGAWHTLFAFAPRSRFFELNLIHASPGCFPSLDPDQILSLSKGITRALRFVTAMGFSSMNLSLFSPLREPKGFHPMVSISPRACVGPYQMSDISFQMLIDEFFSVFLPEKVAERYRENWEGPAPAA